MQTLLDAWGYETEQATNVLVLPDGCRDLIMRQSPGESPHWIISALDDGPRRVAVPAGTITLGFRLRPGAQIDEDRLLASIKLCAPDRLQILERLDRFTSQPGDLHEALTCLGREAATVADAACLLDGSVRSLQRLVISGTGRPPSFWLQLARVRRSARALRNAPSIAEIAYAHGYSDQAHMTREFRRWLGATPGRLHSGANPLPMLDAPGYD